MLVGCSSGGGGVADALGEGGGSGEAGASAEVETSTLLWETDAGTATSLPSTFWTPDGGPSVFVSIDGVAGLDPETGERTWELAPPSGAGRVCEVSQDLNEDGVGAVVFERGGECGALVAVDARGGEALWEVDLAETEGLGDSPEGDGWRPPPLVVAEGLVSVVSDKSSVERFAIETGDPLPAPETPWDDDPHCRNYLTWVHSRSYTVAVPDCAGVERMIAFDTESGEELWTNRRPFPQGAWLVGQLLPADDVVLQGEDKLYLFDSSGVLRARIGNSVRGVVTGSTLVSEDYAGGIAGYDLRSGEQLWAGGLGYYTGPLYGSDTGAAGQPFAYTSGQPVVHGIAVQPDAASGGDTSDHVYTWLDPETGETVREVADPRDEPWVTLGQWGDDVQLAFTERGRLEAFQLSE
ncbi:hypothetical protein GCM10022227_20390 [Streptomyces sedi]